jgi:hypothetical protein
MKGKSNTPRRKRLTSKSRIEVAASWIKNYNGKNIISGYSKWFGVDKICAINELKTVGYLISEDLERQIRASIQQKSRRKKEIPLKVWDSDEKFAIIIGYTSGGAPYGITHEEYNLNNVDE